MNSKLLVPVVLLAPALASTTWAQPPGDTTPRPMAATPITHLAVGTVRSIDAAGRSATIDHRAIPSLGMPAMTMHFRLPSPSSPSLKAGDSIAFTFTASADGLTIGSVQSIKPGSTADAGTERQGTSGKGGMPGPMDACPMMGGR